jgi:hypothetical protein
MEVLQAVVRTEYTPLEEVAPDVPHELIAVVDRCLAREPSKRYGSSVELARDLAIFQGTDEASLAEAPTVALGSSTMQAVSLRRCSRPEPRVGSWPAASAPSRGGPPLASGRSARW